MTKATFSPSDHRYMQLAISLAKQGHYTTSPNPRVGCVLVKNGELVGQGYHVRAGQGHAEVNALVQAGNKAQGATAYVTLEPCSHYGRTPPCAKALIKAGVSKVIAAMVDPNPQVSGNGLAMLSQAGIEVQSGLLEQDAIALNPGFIHLMQTKMPYLRCKLAASLDGKTAMASGESKWITSKQARQDVQRLRAQSCAIISGADSIIADNAKMTVRWSELGELKQRYAESELRQPVRVVFDSKYRLTPDLAFFQQPGKIILLRAKSQLEHQQAERELAQQNWPENVEQLSLPITAQGYICLTATLKALATQGLNDVLIESGARLAGAFIEQNLVNELILYQAPKLLGGQGKNLVEFEQITKLTETKQLQIQDCRMVGADLRINAHFISRTNK